MIPRPGRPRSGPLPHAEGEVPDQAIGPRQRHAEADAEPREGGPVEQPSAGVRACRDGPRVGRLIADAHDAIGERPRAWSVQTRRSPAGGAARGAAPRLVRVDRQEGEVGARSGVWTGPSTTTIAARAAAAPLALLALRADEEGQDAERRERSPGRDEPPRRPRPRPSRQTPTRRARTPVARGRRARRRPLAPRPGRARARTRWRAGSRPTRRGSRRRPRRREAPRAARGGGRSHPPRRPPTGERRPSRGAR